MTVGNRLLFMGVLTQAMLRQETSLPNVFLGIGKAIKSREVMEFAANVSAQLMHGI